MIFILISLLCALASAEHYMLFPGPSTHGIFESRAQANEYCTNGACDGPPMAVISFNGDYIEEVFKGLPDYTLMTDAKIVIGDALGQILTGTSLRGSFESANE